MPSDAPDAAAVLDLSRALGLRIATAESCTGGLIAAALTSIPGSSDVFDRGFVTYSNAAKADMLGVDMLLIADHGAVSAEVARAMARGALRRSKAALAVSVTGIAGPGGGSETKPVGLVFFGVGHRHGPAPGDMTVVHHEQRFGALGRDAVRMKSAEMALALMLRTLEALPSSMRQL
jgi:nicotinamide-nucleotide amidase